MRGRLREERSYARRVELGEVIVGGTVGHVVESRHPGFRTGDFVLGAGGWQTFAVSEGRSLRRLDPEAAPISTALGVLGMPGLTAWVGLLDIGRPRPGQTVVVSAAAGAVGSVVGQLAKIHGCRAVGVAGTPDKCRWVVEALGFDAAVCHRSDDLVGALREACPDGIDVYFDNVGGRVLEAVLRLVNVGARIPLCGLVAEYNAPEPPPGPNLRPVLFNRVTIQGFIVSDHAHREPQFLEDMGRWVREGRVRYREDIVEGLARAPEAFIGLLEGRNFGKLLVRVTPDPTRR
jgi:NADPH-dependent curcumin reductase CurA